MSAWPEATKFLRRAVVNFDHAIEVEEDFEDAWLERVSTEQLILAFEEDSWASTVPKLEQLKQTYDEIQKKFPESTTVKPARASFLRRSANYKFDHWDSNSTFNVPLADRVVYDQALLDIKESKHLILELEQNEPINPKHLYQYIWSQEIETLLLGLNRDWTISFDDSIVRLGALREEGGIEAVNEFVQTAPEHQWRREAANYLIPEIDRSDLFLERLKPFDGKSFSHVEAVYFNYKARALVEAQLRFDFAAGYENMKQALALSLTFPEKFPTHKTAWLEAAQSYTEIAQLLTARQIVDGTDQSATICESLYRAEASHSDYVRSFGEDDVYRASLEYHAYVSALSDCK